MQLLYIVPLSFGLSISVLVGQAIGSGNVAKAKRLMIVSILMSLVSMIFLTVLVYNFGYILIESIVSDKEICELAFQNLRVYCIFYIIDGI